VVRALRGWGAPGSAPRLRARPGARAAALLRAVPAPDGRAGAAAGVERPLRPAWWA